MRGVPRRPGIVRRPVPWLENRHPEQRHLEARARVRRQGKVALAHQGDLVEQLQQFGIGQGGQFRRRPGIRSLPGQDLGIYLVERRVVQRGEHVIQRRPEIHRAAGHPGHRREHRRSVTGRHGPEQVQGELLVDHAQHDAHPVRPHFPVAVRDGLVQQAQGVPHTAVRRACQHLQSLGIEGDVLRLEDAPEVILELLDVHGPQVELDAARQDGGR